MNKQTTTAEYEARFGSRPSAIAEAPGRVNLIGGHLDYNQGLVLPMAINRTISAAGSLNDTGRVKIVSVNQDAQAEFPVSELVKSGGWEDYPKGVLREFAAAGFRLQGLNMLIRGDVPQGGGLSSSAALEVAVAALVDRLTEAGLSGSEIALLCQRAENDFVGVRCGIMDQFTSALSRKDHLLLLDCRSLEYRHVPFRTNGVKVAIFDTRTKRSLAASEFNTRHEECEQAAKLLGRKSEGIESLRDVSLDLLEACRGEMPETLYRRALHVITEIDRVREAAGAVERGDMETLGALLNAAHESLRDNYEVSSPELETAHDAALPVDGVLGGRLTGAGFGGCLVFLVREQAMDQFARTSKQGYRESTGIDPEITFSDPGEGVTLFSPD